LNERADDPQYKKSVMPRTSVWPEGKVDDSTRDYANIASEMRISMIVFSDECLLGLEGLELQ
jgi:hypothetical protein